jgi:hypothetical protein
MVNKWVWPKVAMRDEKETNTGSPKSGDGYGDGDSILVSERAQVAIRSESAIESYGPKFGVNLNGGGPEGGAGMTHV